MSAERPRLLALAERLGVASSYWDLQGRARPTSDATREALVTAMGFDASGEDAAERALTSLAQSEAAALLEPVLVWREFENAEPSLSLQVPETSRPLDYEVELCLEEGARHRAEGRIDPGPARAVRVALPLHPPLGYHAAVARLAGSGIAPIEGRQHFVMAPRTATPVAERLGDARVFGLWANLYSVRSRRNWGFGDLGDLAALLRWCGAEGGAFVGVNPLHACSNRGSGITPYSPASRLYRNVLYLDVEAVPEWSACPAARAKLADPGFAAALARLQAAPEIDYGAVLDAKLAVLRDLYEAFRRERSASRGAAYLAFTAAEGDRLRDFATWEALAEHFGTPGSPDTDWSRWPASFRHPGAPAVQAFRLAHADEVEFRSWLQFELWDQLGRAAAAGRSAGLAIGLYQDLAVGSAPGSADTWMAQPLFVSGVSVGAPPDDYAPNGQNWGFPPLDPRRLRADGYRFFSALLRAGFAHAGALRIDHAMGLLRLFWIPAGGTGSDGTYVHYRPDELLGIVALESRRHRALVIAEDLGTVPPEFPPLLVDWGILSSSVLYFERDGNVPRAADRVSPRALATVETHDLVPLAGFGPGRDLEIRHAVGQLADDAALAAAQTERSGEYRAWIARLREQGCLPADHEEPDPVELAAAVHSFLARTPAPLVAASLDDLAGEVEPVNVPGVPVELYRSWSRRMGVPLEAIAETPIARAVLAALAIRARPLR